MKRHCDLCDRQKLSLKQGNLCGVTNKKPSFNNLCTKIEFNNKLRDLLEAILIDFEDLNQSKNKVYKKYFSGLLFGGFIVLFGFLFWKYFLDIGQFSRVYLEMVITFPAIILGVGFIIIKNAINKLNSYKSTKLSIENEKNEIDEILSLYHKKYTYKVIFDKEIHGIQEVEIKIKFS